MIKRTFQECIVPSRVGEMGRWRRDEAGCWLQRNAEINRRDERHPSGPRSSHSSAGPYRVLLMVLSLLNSQMEVLKMRTVEKQRRRPRLVSLFNLSHRSMIARGVMAGGVRLELVHLPVSV